MATSPLCAPLAYRPERFAAGTVRKVRVCILSAVPSRKWRFL
ncbi:hypothetical protein GGQ59_002624 [Parvularcula dongshanensis]|uniref:Uncharacterized protein n=1 Tax=Parvularcula dongshanensis TaxID=1173995 RepID=A0A840I7Z4_9PROT|nr:hypothetical protein [Parvularcula dongshanensis]